MPTEGTLDKHNKEEKMTQQKHILFSQKEGIECFLSGIQNVVVEDGEKKFPQPEKGIPAHLSPLFQDNAQEQTFVLMKRGNNGNAA